MKKQNKEEIEMTCVVCNKKYNSQQETIQEGSFKGCKVIDAYCSDKCRKIMENKLKTLEEFKEKGK